MKRLAAIALLAIALAPNAAKAADGITDLLTAFWFSKKSEHHGKHHFAAGVAAQFPTASDDTLGSGKWSFGPSFDYEYESGRWFAGAIALQVWPVAGDEDRKSVNMLMIKPFAYYSVSEHWDLMYVPYGVQVYWTNRQVRRCISLWAVAHSDTSSSARYR